MGRDKYLGLRTQWEEDTQLILSSETSTTIPAAPKEDEFQPLYPGNCYTFA